MVTPDEKNPFPLLRQLAQRAAKSAGEQCDLCGEPVPANHRHLLNLSSRELLCACRACVILFDARAAGGGVRRLVPTRYLSLPSFSLTDGQWESLRVPVNMAFFTYNSGAGRVMAVYPSPAGPTESLLTLETWTEIEEQNPILRGMERDVEALLANRLHGATDYYLTPIDECYRLVGIIRAYWRGLSGGREVWPEVERFFAELKGRAQTAGEHDA